MNGITFNRENGGLNRRLAGEDHVSGLILTDIGAAESRILLLRTPVEAEQSGITAAAMPIAHYHISEFFRLAAGARLYVMIVPGEFDASYTEIKTLQQFAEGKLRQVAVLRPRAAVATIISETATANNVCSELAAQNMPLSVIITPKLTNADIAGLPDIHTANAERVSVCIAADGGGYGAWLQAQESNSGTLSIGAAGALLGAIARSRVSDSIGWVERYNTVSSAYPRTLTGGETKARELDVPALCDGTLISDLTPAQIKAINEKGYIFLIKHTGAAGTYWNDGFTGVKPDSDYAYIENNRTVDKACRGVYAALLPKISGPVYVDPETGTLTADSVAALEELASESLEQMRRDSELSGYAVSIDPEQEILSTGKLNVTIRLVSVGVLREITVSIGFTLNITA